MPARRIAADRTLHFAAFAITTIQVLSGADTTRYGFIDTRGNLVIPMQFSHAQRFSAGLAPVQSGGKWGFISRTGKVVVPMKYDDAYEFAEDFAVVAIGDKSGFINSQGNQVIDTRFDDADFFSEGMSHVTVGDRHGFIDKSGALVIKPMFDDAASFSEGLAAVKMRGKWGYIDKAGKLVIPARFSSAGPFRSSLAPVRVGGQQLVSIAGREVSSQMIKGGAVGYIDKTGRFSIKPKFFEGHEYQEGMARVSYWVAPKFVDAYINTNGEQKFAVPEHAIMIPTFREGLLPLKKNGRFGYVDVEGTFKIAAQFDDAEDFSEGKAAVTINSRCGYIDKTGSFVVKPQYETCGQFHEGLAYVSK